MNTLILNKQIFGKKHATFSDMLGNLILLFCIYLIVMFFIFSQIYTPVGVDGSSMMPTLNASYGAEDIVYYKKAKANYGDIVIIKISSEKEIIKRVIGLPGDKINFILEDGNYYLARNGEKLVEDYIYINGYNENGNQTTYKKMYVNLGILEEGNNLYTRLPESFEVSTDEHTVADFDYVVPSDHYFCLGDHREVSNDSSYYGAFKKDDIVGKVFFRARSGKYPLFELFTQFFWPFQNIL